MFPVIGAETDDRTAYQPFFQMPHLGTMVAFLFGIDTSLPTA